MENKESGESQNSQAEERPKAKNDAELKEIAVGIAEGRIFTNGHLRNQRDMLSVFMPLALGALKDRTEEELKDIGLFYEHLSEAGPRSVNGNPCFMSVRMLTKDETGRMQKFYDAYTKVKKDFLGDDDN